MSTRRIISGQLLKVGERAPDFSLPDQDGNVVTLADLRGTKNVVLIFYPGDNLPVCTKQLCTVRDNMELFAAAHVAVFGVNPRGAASHGEFARKHALPFPLLVDAEDEVIRAYGCKGILLTKRTVYGIDKEGTIVFAARGMPSTADILAAMTS